MSKVFDFILTATGCVMYTGMGIMLLGCLLSNIGYFKKNYKLLYLVLGVAALAYLFVAFNYGFAIASFAMIGIPMFVMLAIGMLCFAISEPVWFALFILASMALGGYSSYEYEQAHRIMFR